ncbi:uncharacterized protein Dwil_GK15971 [Drosophila willistoni]|uniref:Borealin C-terminal domain-containing protein n=2 Tax=Drosophila willistoni TaxID=7260 RepID=B4MSA0_DROWI|nr:uncharacterized protein Dwil_GK15971 [Drosophila willistoni]
MEDTFNAADDLEEQFKASVDTQVNSLKLMISKDLKEMKMGEFKKVIGDLSRFSDFKMSELTKMKAPPPKASCDRRLRKTGRQNDSGLGESISHQQEAAVVGSLRGPLHSARALRRNDIGRSPRIAVHSNEVTARSSSHVARQKTRTPMASKLKSLSADRNDSPTTSPLAFLRYPKPGEIALSKFGSPILTQVMTDSFANVNIPIQDGVLCLTSKKLVEGEVNKDLLKSLDENKLKEIKVLHANLQKIVNAASKAGIK